MKKGTFYNAVSYSRDADLHGLDLEAASRQEYDPTRFQPVLFCAESFETMYHSLRGFLFAW